MSYTRLEQALEAVLPGCVYKVQAPRQGADGKDLTRYLVWTPTGEREVSAEGAAIARIGIAVVTAATQNEEDPLPQQVRAALRAARIAVAEDVRSYDDNMATYYVDIPVEVLL